MSEFKDFLGHELRIGDPVAFILPNYRQLTKGKIIAFTPQQIRIEYTKRAGTKYEHVTTHLTYPNCVTRIFRDLTLEPNPYTPSEQKLLGRRVETLKPLDFHQFKVEAGEKATIYSFTNRGSDPIIRFDRNHAWTGIVTLNQDAVLLEV